VTKDNYKELLKPLLTEGGGQGFCVNLSVDTGSLDLMKLCRKLDVLYIDTVVEPWLGFYFDKKHPMPSAPTTRCAKPFARKKKNPGGTTAVSCCGANPGMVSWFVKQALVNLANDTRLSSSRSPASMIARLGQADEESSASRASISPSATPSDQVAQADQRLLEHLVGGRLHLGGTCSRPNSAGAPMRTGCRRTPRSTRRAARRRSILSSPAPTRGCGPGARPPARNMVSSSPTTSRFRSPTFHRHNKKGEVTYRPTCHYAYHPANDAVLSLHEMFGNGGNAQPVLHVLDENELVEGVDELGVLLYGHGKNAYWYGSRLSLEETRRLAPYQNATGLQVTSAVLAGMVWALENPQAGIVEADEVDYKRCLEVQCPISARWKATTPTGPRSTAGRDCSRRISTKRSVAVPQCPGALTPR
jgi:homospermidine synthase